ncbi:hypothetical protein ACIHFE_29435 [Streptomyces sp. NPDC052396]|uniref:hypothetical protein n=1 Tax=Streptomyces sp. NPDC052396 TaxID=3365689 RepID=UPI0037CF5899
MPRGRHRHSTSLHRLLPSALVAATSVACAASAWTVDEPVVIRGLAAAAAAAAVVGSVLMRRWDRAAGKRVAQLTAARVRDEWKTDERIAELETDLEETRQARTRLEGKLRGKRAELARLRTEHADLLRRYATAETGRASALEGRRLLENGREKAGVPRVALALESAIQARASALPAARGAAGAAGAAAAYQAAADALRDLAVNGERQRVAVERTRDSVASTVAPTDVPDASTDVPADVPTDLPTDVPTDLPAGLPVEGETVLGGAPVKPSAPVKAPVAPVKAPVAPAKSTAAPAGKAPLGAAASAERPAGEAGVPAATDVPAAPAATGGQAVKSPETAVPSARAAAAAVTSSGLVRRVPAVPVARTQGGFDFFGNNRKPAVPAARPVEEQDLADVVGAEAEEALAQDGADAAEGEVIDLTAHDDTEQIDVVELRSAI